MSANHRMLPRAGIDSVAWSFLLDRIHACQSTEQLDQLKHSIVAVHGQDGGAVKTLHDTLNRRRAELLREVGT